MKKWIFFTVLALILSVIAAGIFFPNLYEDKLKASLEQQVLIQSDSAYSVSLNKLDISIWRRKIVADSLILTPSNNKKAIKSITATSISIKQIKWFSLLFDKTADFGAIEIDQPYIEIYSRPIRENTFANISDGSDNEQPIDLSTFDITITNGKARLVEPSGRTEVMLEHFTLEATKVDIPRILDGSKLPFLDELILYGKDLTWRLDDKLYRAEIKEFNFDRVAKNASVKNVELIPVLPEYEFSRIKGFSTDRIDLKINDLQLTDIVLDSLYIPRIQVDNIDVNEGFLYVFKNKTIPSKPTIGYRSLLSELSRKIGIQIGVNNININDFKVTYTEHKEKANEPGTIFFEDLSGQISSLKTEGFPGYASDTLTWNLSTSFMDLSTLHLNVSYPLFKENEEHRVWGSLGRIETATINPTLLHLAFVRAESGVVNSLYFDFTSDDSGAKGEILLDYEDLKLTFLNSDDIDDKNLGTRLKSFFANTIVVDSDNTGDIEPEKIDFEWDKRKGLFGYWWHSLLSGIKNTIK